jgi:hypothetical protein
MQIAQRETQLQENASGFFCKHRRETGSGSRSERPPAEIGQQVLKIDFVADALNRIGDASEKC